MSEIINVTRSSMPEYEEYCKEIRSLWDSRFLTNMGEKHLKLESALLKYLKAENITLFTNGHLALENIIAAMGLTGEVITTPFTFASTTHAIVRCGCTPVFCDINPDDYTIDADKIEALITDKTSAIVPVHVYGNLCNVEKIADIAKRHNLKVIYDAAHAFGITKDGVGVATFGDAAMFSFHATKVFHTIEGGCVCYADHALQGIMNDLKNFGIHGPESVPAVGGNAKFNEFCAAMGICNLRHVDDEIAKRKAVYDQYMSRLSNIDGIKLNYVKDGVRSNYAYFPVVFENYKYSRDDVFNILGRQNIVARKYFYPLTNSFDCYNGREGFDVDLTPVAKRISDEVLCLPMFADLDLDIVDRICDLIIK